MVSKPLNDDTVREGEEKEMMNGDQKKDDWKSYSY